MFRRPSFASLVVGAIGVIGVTACDTGDGTTLRDPTAPTTLPPPTAAPVETPAPPPTDVVLGDAAGGTIPGDLVPPAGMLIIPAWPDGGEIDARFGCDGLLLNPPVSWGDLPEGTAEVAISFENLTEESNGRPFLHWVMAGIDPVALATIGEGEVPVGAVTGINFFGEVGYTGPCPDVGTTETFLLTVWALSQQVELPDATPGAELLDFIADVAIDSASVTGTFTR